MYDFSMFKRCFTRFQSLNEATKPSLNLNKTTESERRIMDASGVSSYLHCALENTMINRGEATVLNVEKNLNFVFR